MSKKVIMIGAFPPPVHGMAVINQAMKEVFVSYGYDVSSFNIAAPSLTRGFSYHFVKIWRVVRALLRFAASPAVSICHLYMNVSSGYGQFYEALFAMWARLRGVPVTLHHHSYGYLNSKSSLARLLFAFCPEGTRHIALSAGMASKLRDMYRVSNVQVVSNAAFLRQAESDFDIRPLTTLGFLSNISPQKGIREFIKLVDECRAMGLAVEGAVAGPFQDRDIEIEFRGLISSRSNVRYVGPVYGAQKDLFLRSMDVLIFPSHNEAEPVTIHEALRLGIPVIASGHGAIPEMLDGTNGLSIPPAQDFVKDAADALSRWIRDEEAFRRARDRALRHFASGQSSAIDVLRSVVASF